jgi:hypothetical protein
MWQAASSSTRTGLFETRFWLQEFTFKFSNLKNELILLRTYEVRATVNEEYPGARPNYFQLFIQAVFLICIKYIAAASVI